MDRGSVGPFGRGDGQPGPVKSENQLRSTCLLSVQHYRILKGGVVQGEGYKGALGKLREYKGIMGITRLPSPLDQSPLKDVLTACHEQVPVVVERCGSICAALKV